jgi:hypothetical protein
VTTNDFPDLAQVETPERWAPLAAYRGLPDLGKPLHDQSLADAFYQRLREYIEGVVQHLQPGQQLEVYYFSAGGPILVTQFGYINPNIMVIYGLDVESNRCSFVVHMSRVELEVRIRAIEQPVKRNTIGFIHPAHPAAKAATPAGTAPTASGSPNSTPSEPQTDASEPANPAPSGIPPTLTPPTP